MTSLRHAIKIAHKSTFRYQYGAIVLAKGKIIARGFNQANKTHPNAPRDRYYSLHAEIHALTHAKNKGDTLIVVRIKKNGQLALSKPCQGCMKAIKSTKIKCVIYTDNNENVHIMTVV